MIENQMITNCFHSSSLTSPLLALLAVYKPLIVILHHGFLFLPPTLLVTSHCHVRRPRRGPAAISHRNVAAAVIIPRVIPRVTLPPSISAVSARST